MRNFLKGAFVLLIAVVLTLSTAVTAETEKDTDEGKTDNSCIKTTNLKPTNTIIAPALGPVGFSQPPVGEEDPWAFYTSDRDMNYLCMDDFWELTEDICDIHWWGLSLIYDNGWYSCPPSGMVFEIIFYDINMNPVCTFTNLTPIAVPTGKIFSGFEMYYWETDLDPCCPLTDGWVSIQSIYSPSGCSFLWTNSLTGNLNADQNGNPLNDNLAFELTYKKSRYINTPFLNLLEFLMNQFPILKALFGL